MPARQGVQTKVRTRLGRVRAASGLTQADMARLTGVSLSAYRRLERGANPNPGVRVMVNCARVLRASINDVMEPEWGEWFVFPGGPGEPENAGFPPRT